MAVLVVCHPLFFAWKASATLLVERDIADYQEDDAPPEEVDDGSLWYGCDCLNAGQG